MKASQQPLTASGYGGSFSELKILVSRSCPGARRV